MRDLVQGWADWRFSERMTRLEVSACWHVESNGPMKESVVAAWTSCRLEKLPGIA
jgi:hypothetical protein